MAYKVSEEYKKVIYSGEANHDLYVEYGGEVLKEASSRISNFRWVRKILSNGNKYFSLDNFIAQNIELIFYKTLELLTLKNGGGKQKKKKIAAKLQLC